MHNGYRTWRAQGDGYRTCADDCERLPSGIFGRVLGNYDCALCILHCALHDSVILPLLHVYGIEKRFGATVALDGVTFELEARARSMR